MKTKDIIACIIIFLLIGCAKCPTQKTVDRYIRNKCLICDTIKVQNEGTITIVQDSNKIKGLEAKIDSLSKNIVLLKIDSLIYIDTCFSKPKVQNAVSSLIKEGTKKYIKENKNEICGFIQTIEDESLFMILTWNGTNLDYDYTIKTTKAVFKEDNIWKYWKEAIILFFIGVGIGFMLPKILKLFI